MEQHTTYEEIVDITNVNSEVHFVSEQVTDNIEIRNENGESIAVTYDKVTLSTISPNEAVATNSIVTDVKESKRHELIVSPKTIKDAYENSELLIRDDSPEMNDITSCNNVGDDINHEELAFCANQGKLAEDYELTNKDTVEDGNESVDEQILLNVSDDSHTVEQPEQKLMDMFAEQEDVQENVPQPEETEISSQASESTKVQADVNVTENETESKLNVDEDEEEIQVDDASNNDSILEIDTNEEQSPVLSKDVAVPSEELCEKLKEVEEPVEDESLLKKENVQEKSVPNAKEVESPEETLQNVKKEEIEIVTPAEAAKVTEIESIEIEEDSKENSNDEPNEVVEEIQEESSLSNNFDEIPNNENKNEEISGDSDNKEQENGADFDEDNDESIQLADSSMISEPDNANDSKSAESNQKVIQDIFDDWREENAEEPENRVDSQQKMHDSVELELQHLLSDSKSLESEDDKTDEISQSNDTNHRYFQAATSPNGKADDSTKHLPKTGATLQKSANFVSSRDISETKKGQSPRPGVKNPSLNLTSQIVSKSEVTEVLKERLREKQKDLVVSPTADIVFVKKITQRLSKGLAAASQSVPGLIPLPQTLEDDKSEKKDEKVEASKSSSSDHTELLAILEGDVDLDWSNLKSPSLVEDGKDVELAAGKLDPSIERELALKQLMELPNLPSKKSPKRKKTFKPAPGKDDETENVDEAEAPTPSVSEEETESKQSLSKENNSQNAQTLPEYREEETRSGRKRKLTEKAREHEQNVNVKRQKVYRGKNLIGKKSDEMSSDEKPTNKSESNSEIPEKSPKKESSVEPTKTPEKEIPVVKSPVSKVTPVKRLRQGILKKDHPIAKRKHAVKNLIRQKMVSKKVIVKDVKKSPSKSPSKGPKPATATDKPRKKSSNEIDKLLQDEGVVNLLYNVEQSDSKKRLVPLTKSQTKVVDVEKAERELNLRKKLVRNAVLRLRGASTPTKISPRSRRFAVPVSEPEKKSDTKNNKADFIIPAKIRNAADASRIIRRHSSSSFSSASGSPRVSVDTPDKIKSEESEPHALRSKRRHSLIDKKEEDVKKSKKKMKESEDKEEEPKKETRRVSTRSNAPLTKTVKGKKVPKIKTPVESESESDDDDDSKNDNELSVVLANAANVLMSINSTRNATTNRKTKNSTNVKVKTNSDDSVKVDVKSSFSNKEILVRRNGYLVQLILNPSASSSGIRNGITIEVMQEMREALAILSRDQECRVVLLTSSGTSFCEGLDLSPLVQANKEERKRHAEEMAASVKDFIKSLAAFNKPIVAGVQGAAVGLGVTMLPLFDLVIASDKATFNTPYGKLGQIAEGAAILTLSTILGNAVTSELLLGGRTLTASEALRAGLVTRVLWPDRFQVELLPSLKAMSEQSTQSMEATKTLLRHSLRNKLDKALETESLLLVQHWCSAECQDAMKAYIDGKVQ